jgi:hypothetical protein
MLYAVMVSGSIRFGEPRPQSPYPRYPPTECHPNQVRVGQSFSVRTAPGATPSQRKPTVDRAMKHICLSFPFPGSTRIDFEAAALPVRGLEAGPSERKDKLDSTSPRRRNSRLPDPRLFPLRPKPAQAIGRLAGASGRSSLLKLLRLALASSIRPGCGGGA